MSVNTNATLDDIAYGNGKYVITGKDVEPLTASFFQSTDGSNWSIQYVADFLDGPSEVIFGNNKFVGVGFTGKIISSSDGSSWNVKSSGSSANLVDIVYSQ